MYTIRRAFRFALLLVISTVGALAQQRPIIVSVTVLPPYASALNEWERHPERIIVTLTNPDGLRSYAVRLSGYLEDLGGGIKVETKDDFPVSPITVGAGAVRRLDGSELKLFNASAVNVTGSDKSLIARTGQLAEGTYSICIRALDHATREVLSPNPGCATFTIRALEAPMLVSPPCDMKITQTMNPQLVLFQWSPAAGAPPSITYTMSLAEVIPAERNAEEAINTATPPTLYTRELTTTMFQYGAADPQLKKGSRYAWRVRASDPAGVVTFRDDGRSRVCTFIYGDDPMKDTTKQDTARKETKDTTRKEDCTLPAYITGSFPSDNQRLPFRYFPVSVQFDPYCRNYTKFASTYILKNGMGTVVTNATKTIEWKNGPFDNPTRQPDMFEQEESKNIIINNDQNKDEKERKAQFLSPDTYYTWSADVTLTKKVFKGSDSSYEDTKKTVKGRFTVGMGTSELLEPESGRDLPPGTIELKWNTAQPPSGNSLALPFDLRLGNKGGGAKFYAMTVNEKWVVQVSRTPDMKKVVYTTSGRVGAGVNPLDPAQGEQFVKNSIYKTVNALPELKDEGEYFWMVKWLVDPDGSDEGAYYNASEIRRFVVSRNASCFTMSAESPGDGSRIAHTKPVFALRSSTPLKAAELVDGNLRVWRGGVPGDTTTANLVMDITVSRKKSDGGSYIFAYPDGMPWLALNGDLIEMPVNRPGGMERILRDAVPGEKFLWQFTLRHGAMIRDDGRFCVRTLSPSPLFSFVYGDTCLSAINQAPADGEVVGDASGELLVRLSKKIRIANTFRREWFLYELKKGENAKTADLNNGRTRFTVELATDDVFDPGTTTALTGMKISKLVEELAKKGESLKMGTRYAWKFRLTYAGKEIFEEGGSCGGENAVVESAPTSFVYGGCLTLKHLTPAEEELINDATGDFMAEASKPIRIANTSRREWVIYELKKGEDPKGADPDDGRKKHTLDITTDDVYDPDYMVPKFAVSMARVAKELAKKGEALKVGQRYGWKFRLSYSGKGIFEEGGSCGDENAVIESTPTAFIYGGCLTLKHLTPADGQTINNASGDFMAETSKPIRIANTSKREWFFYELKKDEDLKKIDLEDGRKKLTVDVTTDDVFDPDYTVPKFAVSMSRVAKELAKKGEALKIGQRYAWKFRMSYSGKGIFADGSSCGGDNAMTESQPTTFVYGGECVNATNVAPAEGDTLVDATGDFRVKLSVRVRTMTFGDREIELCELKKGEDPAKVDFSDGRERIVVKFERHFDPKTDPEAASMFAIYLSKLLEKLPAGATLKPGTRYAWKMRAFYREKIILEDGATCGRDTNVLESAPTSFVYGGCRFLKGTSPAERANLTTLPEFAFKVQPGVQENQFGVVILKIWKKSPGMSAEDAAKGDPLFDKMFNMKANLGTRTPAEDVTVVMGDEFVAAPRAVVNRIVVDWDLLQNADSSRFKPEEGGEYVWQAKADVMFETEKDKCTGDFLTPFHTFSYRKAGVDTSCLRIIAGWPDDGSLYDRPEDPQFSVIVKPGVKAAGIRGGRLQIWKKLPTETLDSAVAGKPVFDQKFEGSGEANLEIEIDKPEATALKLKFVNYPNAKHTFKPEFGATYAWRFTMAIDGATIMSDGTECSQSEIKSAVASFDYMGGGRNDCGNGEGCEAPEISDKTPSPGSNFSGQDIKAGFFKVRVTESTGSGAGLSGKGTITLPDMKAPVKVVFSNIKVNRSNVMYEGTIKGEVEEAQGIISKVAAKAGRQLELNASDAEAIDNLLQQGKRLVSAMVSSKPIGLPIGIDAVISSRTYTLGILDISLTPKKATFAAGLRIETPDLASGQSTSFINFGARDVCITPTSIGSNGTAKLYVAGDFTTNLGGGMQLKIVAPKGNELDDDSKGTYVRIKCGKFDGLRIEAAAVFPREWLVPANKDGSPNTDATKKVEARFVAQVKDWNNWLAKAELDKCLIAGDNGLGLEVKEMVYDHSDVANPDGITFPQGYGKGTDNTWRGFFIRRAAIALPASLSAYTADGGGKLPVTFAADNLIVDKTGLSANFKVQNIVSTGVIAGWGFSLDEIGVEVVSSSLRKGYMNGAIKLPISEDKLGYECMIRDGRAAGGSAGLEWQFQIKPKNGDYNAKFWYAKLRLDATSNITIGNIPRDPKTGRRVNARAELTGDLSVDYDQTKLKLPQLKFEQFLLQSTPPQGEKRISCKKWSFTSPAKSMGGFPLMIEGIEPAVTEENDVTKVGLKFTIKLALAGEQTSIAGSAGLMIKAKLNMEAEELGEKLEFDGVDLTKIAVNADMGAVKIKGQIDFYKQDPTFGDGFRGLVEAWFLKTIYVNITVQFGSKPSVKNPGENFRYWYVDALARFNPGIVLGPAIGIYGFGGGAWYHMAPKNQLNPALLMQQPENSDAAKDAQKAAAVSSKIGATLSGEEYVPSEETLFGFKASVTLGTVPDPKPLNADVQLMISFTSSGGLERIRFDGSVYMACDIIERKDPALKASASILYDNVNSIFHAEFQVNLNFKVVKAYIPAVVHVEPKWWQLKLGEPKNRMTLELDLAIIKLKFKSYMMAGDSLPAIPDPPDEVMSKLTAEQRAKIEKRAMIKNAGASGFMFGTILQIGPVEGSFLIFYGKLDLGVGFDVEVKKYENLLCGNSEGSGQVGFNGGWYVQGNAYAWIDAEIGLKITLFGSERRFKILALSGAALMRMGFPNPTWFEGYLAAKYSILGGLISGNCNYEFSIGEPCRPRRGSPFEDQVAMIEDITPKDGSKDIPVLATPEISYNFEIGKQFELQDLNDEKKVHTYRVMAERPLMYDVNNILFPSNWSDAYMSKTSQIYPIQMLGGYQKYRIDAAAYAEEYLNGRWAGATYPNASNPSQLDPIRQTKTGSFTTGPQPDYIPWENVTYSSPGVRQRYYLIDHPGTYTEKEGTIVLMRDQGYLLTPKEDQYVTQKLRIRMVAAGGADTVEEDLKYYPAYDRFPAALQFDVQRLQQSTLYHLDIFRETKYKPGVTGSPASGLFEKEEVKEFSQTVEETNIGSGGETRTVTGTYEKKLQKLGQTRVNPLTKAQEKLLWANDFATSAYRSLYTKMMGLTFKRVDRKTDGRLIIHYDAYEPFDAHDLATFTTEGAAPYSWASSFYYPQISNRIFSNIRAYTGESPYGIVYYWSDGRAVDQNLTRQLGQTYSYSDLRPYAYLVPHQQAYLDRGCGVDLIRDDEIASGVINRYPRNRWSYGSGDGIYYAEPHDGPPGNVWFQYTVERDAWNVANWLQGRALEAYTRGADGEWAQYTYKGQPTWLRWQTYFWYMDWSMNNDRTVLSRFQALPGGWYELKLSEKRGDNFEAPNPRYSIWFPYTYQPRAIRRGAGYF